MLASLIPPQAHQLIRQMPPFGLLTQKYTVYFLVFTHPRKLCAFKSIQTRMNVRVPYVYKRGNNMALSPSAAPSKRVPHSS